MTEIDPASADVPTRPARKSRLWRWFAIGFLIVFVPMLFLPTYTYDGLAVRRTRVWKCYMIEIQQACGSSRALGPTSDNSTAALTFALQHVAFSALGGGIAMGGGWFVGRRRRTMAGAQEGQETDAS